MTDQSKQQRRTADRQSRGRYDQAVEDFGIKLDPLSADPLWEQLANALRAQILDGRIPPDRKLPTEAMLADALGIGRSTTARAVAHLRNSGLVVFVPGRGAFSAKADAIARARKKR